MLFRRTSPYNDLNTRHPMLSYTVRHVRGGRSAQGTVRFAWTALWIMAVAGVVPLALFLLFFQPQYRTNDLDWIIQSSYVYILGAGAIMTFMFPLVDFFTVFFAVNSIRAETSSGSKYDLLRTSNVDAAAFVDARLALARVRAWRVMVFMWAGRLVAVGMLVVLSVFAFGVALYEDDIYWELDDTYFWFGLFYFIAAGLIFLVQYLAEPLWRLDMLNAYAASVAVRYSSIVTTWVVLGLGMLVILFFQGALGAGVVYGGVGLYELVDYLFYDRLDVRNYTWDFRDQLSLSLALIPYALMPLVTWSCQRLLRLWRRRVAVRHIFRHQGVDA